MQQRAAAAVLLLFAGVLGMALADLPAGAMIGDITAVGEGCPQGTARGKFTSNGDKVAITFDSFVATTDMYGSGNLSERKTCNIAIPIVVPTGQSLTALKLDFRGVATTPPNTKATLNADLFFLGGDPIGSISKQYVAKSANDFSNTFDESTSVTGGAAVTSPCGQQVQFRINSAVMAEAEPAATDDASIELDALDVAAFEINVKWIPCAAYCTAAENNCGAFATCFILNAATRAKTCSCNSGYVMTTSGCVADPCANNPCGSKPCVPTGSSYTCGGCNAGYQWDANSNSCKDVNECADNNGGCYQGCHNTDGGYYCDPCPVGYSGNGRQCSKTIYEVSFNGNGCPAPETSSSKKSVVATFTANGDAIALMYNDFVLTADPSAQNPTRVQHVSCQVSVPVAVPPGYSVTTYSLDYRGYAKVPPNSHGHLSMEYFFAGQYGQQNETLFTPGMDNVYVARFPMEAKVNLPRSECGQDVILRLSTSLTGKLDQTDASNGEDMLLEVDSADIHRLERQAYINLTWTPCPFCSNPNSLNCGPYGTCRQGQTKQVCVCNDGYEMNQNGQCVDINECLTKNGGCPTNAICTNLNPFYQCSCPAGSVLDAVSNSCVDTNECTVNNGGCYPGVQCTNAYGKAVCGTCPVGYQGDGHNCQPISCGQYPVDTTTMFTPSCNYNSIPPTCSLSCRPHFALTGPQNVQCVQGGWQKSGCALINECAVNNGGCSTTPLRPCSMTNNGPVCGNCPTGYNNNGATGCTCTKGCPGVTCPKPVTNAVLSCGTTFKYDTTCQLSCATGYTLQGASSITCQSSGQWNQAPGTCAEVNECATNNGGCSPKTSCTNTPGGFVCGTCPSGYTDVSQQQSQKGTNCQDINECATNNGGCSYSPLVACTNQPGSYVCGNCPSGYTGNGRICTQVNACAVNNGGCDANAVCMQSYQGGAVCQCKVGYVDVSSQQGQSAGHVCQWQDPCQQHPCDPKVQCQSQSPSKDFQCSRCPDGYIDGEGGKSGKTCIPAQYVKVGTATVSGNGCPQDAKLEVKGVAPNTWQLLLTYPTPFGWNTGDKPTAQKLCQFGLPVTFFYKSAMGTTFDLGAFTYSGAVQLTNQQNVTASMDLFWTGESSIPYPGFQVLDATAPVWTVTNPQAHTLSMPPSGQEQLLRLQFRLFFNRNNLPVAINRNQPLVNSKFLLNSVVVGQLIGLNHYDTNL